MANVERVLAALKSAADLTENAVSDVLDIALALQDALQALPETAERERCLDHVSKLFETCTFEDLAKQHLEKVVLWVQAIAAESNATVSDILDDKDSLLRGPALEGEESVKQSTVDNMLTKH
jgi:hypothetical protein